MELLAKLLKGLSSIAAGKNTANFSIELIWDQDETPDELL